MGEVELAYRVGDGEVLAITGTNGKNYYNSLWVTSWKNYAGCT